MVTYHLEDRIVSAAIRYKKCAQIFVSSVNKTLSDIQFVTLRSAIWYNVNMVQVTICSLAGVVVLLLFTSELRVLGLVFSEQFSG